MASPKLSPDLVRHLMRNDAVGGKKVVSARKQKPQGRSGPVAKYVPGTPEYEALVEARR